MSAQQSLGYRLSRGITIFLGIITLLIGIYFLYGGWTLASLGGSWYYVLAGILLIISGILITCKRLTGVYLYALTFIITIVWAFTEAGLAFWPLTARLGLFAALGVPIALFTPSLVKKSPTSSKGKIRFYSWGFAAILLAGLIAAITYAFQPIWITKATQEPETVQDYHPQDDKADWTNYGRTPDGTQFASSDQITPENASQLKVAWTFHTNDFAYGGAENQNTPLQIGDTLYACTPTNKVFAIKADSGEEIWHFDPNVDSAYSPTWQRCRSLAYYQVPQQPQAPDSSNTAGEVISSNGGMCQSRIYVTTANLQLISLDAQSGKPCAGFGNNGTVSLAENMGEIPPGFYNPTAGPVVAGDNLIVGGWIMDNQSTDEPSGAVRAYNAITGKLAWAWDVGRPGITTPPTGDEHYTRGTPNTWAAPTYDAKLGLVYLPTGNGTPDMYGGKRTPETDRVNSSIVALDAKTGQERWVFQTTHHDVWDYDLPSKPILYDMPTQDGQRIPALIQTTKRGEIFVLNRITGKPITDVVEKNVPTDGLPGEHLSSTQPYSVGMPEIRQGVLSESQMWGITPLDQLSCRIAFRQLEYKGDFTPPSTHWYIPHPSPFGTMNWGGATIDKRHDYMIVNDMRIMMKARLIPRDELNKTLAQSNKAGSSVAGVIPMSGTPYGANRTMVTSPLGIPCTNPPFGAMTAIDLKTHKIVWQRSMGTVEQTGPWGIKTRLRIPLGMPTLGGPVATASGLVFFNGTSDYYLRALDVATGKEVWKSPLPVGAQSTPTVFTSPKTGKQYVVVTAGGARTLPERGDAIIAFALPDTK